MPNYKRKAEEVEATQWNKKGDHLEVQENGKDVSFEFQERELEDNKKTKNCPHCDKPAKEHGYIKETVQGGLVVCPGSWIVKGSGYKKVYNDKDFKDKYEVV
jgi:hypothetical protein